MDCTRSCALVLVALVVRAVPSALAAEDPSTVLEAIGRRKPTGAAEAIASAMNPFVLTDLVSERLVLEVDWVEGYRPSPVALRAATEALREHCVAGRRIEIVVDDEIPHPVWSTHSGPGGLERLTSRFLDGDPAGWRRSELVHVLYVPDGAAWYEGPLTGMTDVVTFETPDGVASVRTVLLFTDRIRKNATLWIGNGKVERATLVHELGHVLGLVSDPAHTQSKHPRHCRSARCVMHRPGWRAALVNGVPAFFAGRVRFRYGDRCVDDIETAKRVWARQAASSAGFVRSLKAERLLREARLADAWRAKRGGR